MSEPSPGTIAPPTPKRPKRIFGRLARVLGWIAFTMLVATTLYFCAGRLLLPQVAGETAWVETQLSRLLGLPVHVADLRGRWQDFTPHLEVGTLQLEAPDGTVHRVDDVRFSIDVRQSLAQRALTIGGLTVGRVDLVVEQAPDGRWSLAGMQPGQGGYAGEIVRFLLQTPFLTLDEASIAIRPREGPPLQLHSVFARIRNDGAAHRMQLQFRLGDQATPSRVLIELQGTPGQQLSGRGWLTLPELDLQPLVPPRVVEQWDVSTARGSLGTWFEFDADGAVTIQGQIRNAGLLAMHRADTRRVPLANADLDFVGSREAAGQWQLAVRDLGFDWGERTWQLPALVVARADPEAPALSIRAAQVDLEMLSAIVLDSLPVPDAGAQALRTLAVRGRLDNVLLDTAMDGSFPGLFDLRANLVDGIVDAWQGAPAGSGLHAWVRADAVSGIAEVDADDLSLHLPQLFASPWQYDHVNGRVQWSVQDREVRVWSGLIDVNSTDLDGSVAFAVRNHTDENAVRESGFKLLVGVERMDVVAGKVYLPSIEPLAQTMTWLDDALQGGELHDSAFMLRTSHRDGRETSSSAQSFYQVEGGRLQFLPQWPALLDTTAAVLVRDNAIDVTGRAATIGDIALTDVHARVRQDAEGSWLGIDADATTDTATGHRFLLDSPLHDSIGGTFDSWEGEGQLDISLALGIPLGANPRPRATDVRVVSRDSVLRIPDYFLDFSSVSGELRYTEETGLQAVGLTGVLFDEPLTVSIDSAVAADGERTTLVQGQGHADVSALRDWEGQPRFVSRLLGHTEGELDYALRLEFPGASRAQTEGISLQLVSGLEGLASRLPAPLAKRADESHVLELGYVFSPERTGDVLSLRYDDILSGDIVLDDRGLNRGQLYFGERNRSFNVRQANRSDSGLLVNGDLDRLDYDAWEAIARTLVDGDGGARGLKEALRLVDVNVREFVVRGQPFEAVNLQVQPQPDAWQVLGRNEMLAGSLLLPDDASAPWQVDLEYLRFPPRPERTAEQVAEEDEVDLLENIDPAQLPAIDFRTAELGIGESRLGSFSFALRPTPFGATIDDFSMQADQAAITGIEEGVPALIEWDYRNGFHSSRFTGLLTAANLARVLPDWGHDAFLESESARFSGSLGWPGSPLAFSLKRSSGEISMRIEDGRFVDIDSGSSRLLGAFNFDALVRRLQLDFSDIFSRGFTYDLITGELAFQGGVVTTNDSLIIDGPSSRLRIDGEISLPDETIAADMLVRMPLGQNISMLAGLLGAWPIALSTYVASKIFADQVEDFTTLAYRLEGPWNDVDAGFDAPTPDEENSASETARDAP